MGDRLFFGEIEWDENVELHIGRHEVGPYEVEQLVRSARAIARHRGRTLLFGQTDAGRYLVVVLEQRGKSSRWRPITARDMTHRERRTYLPRR